MKFRELIQYVRGAGEALTYWGAIDFDLGGLTRGQMAYVHARLNLFVNRYERRKWGEGRGLDMTVIRSYSPDGLGRIEYRANRLDELGEREDD